MGGILRVRFIDQVKRYAPDHLVKADEVRAMIGVLSTEPATSKAIVTTTSDFAPKILDDPHIKSLIPGRLELVNGKQLLKNLSEIAKGKRLFGT